MRNLKFLLIGILLGVLFGLATTCHAKEIEPPIKKPLTVEEYRVQRSQLERMRRRLIYEMGNSPEWMHSKEQVQKVYQTVILIDTFILQSHLQEQDMLDEQAEQQEYIKLKGYKGDSNADTSN